MRTPIILLAALLGPADIACAQVTVDLHALDALPGGGGRQPAPAPLPASRPAPRSVTALPPPPAPVLPSQAPATPSQATTVPSQVTATPSQARATPSQARATPSQAAASPPPALRPIAPPPAAPPPQPELPTQSPAVAALTPVAPPLPSAELAPPPPPPISATATTEAKPSGGGLQLTFGVSEAELNPASVDAIRQFAGAGAATTTTFNVLAYAAGSLNDPSAARRLSLSRALAVRSALMADGVASSRIFVRALGSQAGDGPADRVDINRLGGSAASGKTP